MLRNLARRGGVEAATMQRLALVLVAAGGREDPGREGVRRVGLHGLRADGRGAERGRPRRPSRGPAPAPAEYHSISFGRHTRDASDGRRYWYAPATGSFALDWVPNDLVAAVRSPWTDGRRNLLFSPSARAVRRGDVLVPLSARDARAPLRRRAPSRRKEHR
jgi:hypothetical protein